MFQRTVSKCVCCAGLTALVLYSACGPAGTAPSSGGSGELRVLVTDKPFPFEFIAEALVTITRVEVRRSGETTPDANGNANSATDANAGAQTDTNANDNGAAEAVNRSDANADDGASDGDSADAADADSSGETDSDRPFTVLFDEPEGRTFNLLDLRNGRTDLLAQATLPAGTYTQMRLIVSSGRVTLTDGRMFDLRVPSGEQTGIKLNFRFDVSGDAPTVLLLDVDLSRAFTPIPGGRVDSPDGIREFRFSPSLAMRLVRVVDAGSVSGLVTDANMMPVPDVAVTAYNEQTEVTSTTTDANGMYTLTGLPTGTYRVEFSAMGFADILLADLTVTAGQPTVGVNATLTAAAP